MRRKSTEPFALRAPALLRASSRWDRWSTCRSPPRATMILKPGCPTQFINVTASFNATLSETPVEISADKVVLIHYTLKDDAGAVIDSSAGGEPLVYIQGHGNLVSGLEKALEGKENGNTLKVVVTPAEGYGTHDAALIQRVPKRSLQSGGAIQKGAQFQARTDDGMRLFTVTALIGDMVTL